MKQIIVAAVLGLACLLSAHAAEPLLSATEELDGPYTIAYRIFTGDYKDNGPVFASLTRELRDAGVVSTRSLGIYLDDPKTTPPQGRRCVCGVIIEEKDWPRIEQLPRSMRIQHIPRAVRIVCRYPVKGAESYLEGGARCYPLLSAFARRAGRTPVGSFEVYDGGSISYVVRTLEKEDRYSEISEPAGGLPSTEGAAWPDPDWQQSSPEAQGMDSGQLSRSLALVPTMWDLGEIDSLLVIRHGRMVLETYFHPNTPRLRHELHSVTKSVTSTLVGIAVRQGLVRPEDLALSFFSGRSLQNPGPDKAAIAIRNLLNMQSGLDFQEFPLSSRTNTHWQLMNSNDWAAFSLDLPMAARPGTRFNYSDADMAVLGGILKTVTGGRTEDFAAEQLFAPLGISNWEWKKDPQGSPVASDGLFLTPRDMAKIGYLYLRGGLWKGRRILPEGWIRDITARSVATGMLPPRYGMLWWVDGANEMFSACGAAGQYIIVMPRQDIVAVVAAKQGMSVGNPGFPEIAHTLVLPAVKSDGPLPENEAAFTELRRRIRRFESPQPQPVPRLPDTATRVSGRKILLDSKPLGLSSLTLRFTGNEAAVDMDFGKTHVTLPVGLDGLQRTSLAVNSVSYASFGFWENEKTFCIESRVLQGDFLNRLRFQFQGDDVLLTYIVSDELGWPSTVEGHLQGAVPAR
jgi:CubicO group peptidase (beta-lactamase class C family)